MAPNSHSADECSKARSVLSYAHEAAQGFLNSFSAVRRERGANRGTTSDDEQDLARASVVFAAAGLDSALKHLLREALPALVRFDDKAKKGLEDFVERSIKSDSFVTDDRVTGRRFLARVLTADNQLDELIDQYKRDLTGSSLQSAAQVESAAAALGLDWKELKIDRKKLKSIFNRRNKIIHELDIDFSATNRNRSSRTKNNMATDANAILEAGENILRAIEKKLSDAA